MNCEKCGEKISQDSIFCEFCGHKIKKEKEAPKADALVLKENTKDATIIQNENLKQMSNHLEFLGYEIRKNDPIEGDNRESIFTIHPENLNLTILEVIPNFILFRTLLPTKKKPSAKIDAFLNDTNKNLLISKVYREVEDDIVYLRIESIYTGNYVKDIFARFIDLNIKEHNQLRASDDFSKLFVD